MASVREGNELHKTMTVQVVGAAEQELSEVRHALEGVNDPPVEVRTAAPGSAENGDRPADLAMVVFDDNEAAALTYLQSHAEGPAHPRQFALMHEPSPALMRRALRAGADEILFLPLKSDEIGRALLKFAEHQRKHGDRGYICSVISLTGGAGLTALSGNLALALNYGLDKRVVLVDLNLQNDGMGIFLHLNPAHTIVDLAHGAEKFDSIRLESALTKHPSGIYLLAAPKRFEDAGLITDTLVTTILELMGQLFDYVVVDCGPHIDERTVAALLRSDEVLYVIDQSLPAVRTALRFTEFFSRLGVREVEPRLVVNKFDAQSQISLDDIGKRWGKAVFATVARDDRVAERMQLYPEDLWGLAPGSQLVQSMENLASRLALRREPRAEPAGNFVTRLLTSIGARA